MITIGGITINGEKLKDPNDAPKNTLQVGEGSELTLDGITWVKKDGKWIKKT